MIDKINLILKSRIWLIKGSWTKIITLTMLNKPIWATRFQSENITNNFSLCKWKDYFSKSKNEFCFKSKNLIDKRRTNLKQMISTTLVTPLIWDNIQISVTTRSNRTSSINWVTACNQPSWVSTWSNKLFLIVSATISKQILRKWKEA